MKYKTKKYRFNNTSETVYEIEGNDYVNIGSYYSYGITKSMTYEDAAQKVEEYKNNN